MTKFTYFVVMVGLVACVSACENDSSNENNEIMEEKESQIIELKKQIEYYKQFSQDALLNLNDEELHNLAKMEWTYSLYVNDQMVPKDGKVIIQEDKIHISLSQEQSPYTVLPDEIVGQGAISGKYEEHIQNLEPIPTETNWTDGTVVTAIHFNYTELPRDSTVSFSITEELKERLGLDTTVITIRKNNNR